APGRLIDHHDRRATVEFPTDNEFLQVAARQGSSFRVGRALSHVHRVDDALGGALHNTAPHHTAGADEGLPVGRMARQQEIFRESHARGCAMPQPLLGNESCTQQAAARYAERTGILPTYAHGAGILLPYLAGYRLEEFALPIARHARNADNLAGTHRKGDVSERD